MMAPDFHNVVLVLGSSMTGTLALEICMHDVRFFTAIPAIRTNVCVWLYPSVRLHVEEVCFVLQFELPSERRLSMGLDLQGIGYGTWLVAQML